MSDTSKDLNGVNFSTTIERRNETAQIPKMMALTVFIVGPFVTTNPDTKQNDYHYRLYRSPESDEFAEINWRDIRWIEGYPDTAADMIGDAPKNIGRRTIWVDRNLRLEPQQDLSRW